MAKGILDLIRIAREVKASDVHLESGSPAFLRIQGELKPIGEAYSYETIKTWAMDLLGPRADSFRVERSIDLSETLAGVRCRVHIFHSAKGLSCSIRLLAQIQPTLSDLNLHPNLQKIIELKRGLVLVCGPTGSGKSSTIAALVQEFNLRLPYNIVTLEQPIEYFYRSQKSLIRQREIGRDAPSFEKGLIDAMREDPDVIVVGEMRERETIQLTLNAAETGHLVLATFHASTVAEGLGRILSAFPAKTRDNIASQLAQVLQVVVCQQLSYIEKFQQRVPICELYFSTTASRNKIRIQELSSIPDTYYAGAEFGCMPLLKYRQWVEAKTSLKRPTAETMPLENPILSDDVIRTRYEARNRDSKKAEGGIYSVDDAEDDDLWTAIRSLEGKP